MSNQLADGTPFRPADAWEGLDFNNAHCCRCRGYGPGTDPTCEVLAASFVKQVPEWTYQDGLPSCSAFKAEIGLDGEPLPEHDPRQLAMEVSHETHLKDASGLRQGVRKPQG